MKRVVLKINESEYDVLRFSYKFQRDIDAKGRPHGNYYGGGISVLLESTDNAQLFQLMVCKDMLTVDGSIEVLSGEDGICVRRIEFKEAHVCFYGEQFQSASWLPVTMAIDISPMRLDFNNRKIRLDRKWPRAPHGWQKYEEGEAKYVKPVLHEEKKSMKIIEAYWIDKDNRKRKDLLTDYPVKLYIVLEDYTIGTEAKFRFANEDNTDWDTGIFSGIIGKNGIVEIDGFQLIKK